MARQQKSRRGAFSATPIPQNTKSPVLTCVNFPFLSSPLVKRLAKNRLDETAAQSVLKKRNLTTFLSYPYKKEIKAKELYAARSLGTKAFPQRFQNTSSGDKNATSIPAQ